MGSEDRFVVYLRSCPERIGIYRLDVGSQRTAVNFYLEGRRATILLEVTEIESKKTQDRPALSKALDLCHAGNAILLIAKLDRLARDVTFMTYLAEARTEFIAIDMPSTNELPRHTLGAVAAIESQKSTNRLKAGLQAAKQRGTKLGGLRQSADDFASQSPKGRAASAAVRGVRSAKFSAEIMPVIREIQGVGITSLRQIAVELNRRGKTTLRGGQWISTSQVQRVIRRSERTAEHAPEV